jgi:PE-PPE domain
MIELPGSATLPGGTGATNYYMITQPNLPLLDPVRAIPITGNPIADLAQRDLAVLVNLGYGSTAQGWSTGPANVPTPFGVIPPVSPGSVISALAAGTQQGMGAFAGDIGAGIAGIPSPNVSLPDMSSIGMSGGPSLLPAAPTLAPAAIDGFIQAVQTANTTIVNGISGAAANARAVLLPTADIASALATSLPSYDVNLFLDGV